MRRLRYGNASRRIRAVRNKTKRCQTAVQLLCPAARRKLRQKKAGRHYAHPLCRHSCCEKKETYFFLFFAPFLFAPFFAFFFAATAAPPFG
jgi:hypothetical protein